MPNDRKSIMQSLDFSSSKLDGSLVNVISRLNDALSSIPKEYREQATMGVVADYEYDHCKISVEIYYFRIETEQEFIIRRNSEAALNTACDEKERKEYERLKRKFGSE